MVWLYLSSMIIKNKYIWEIIYLPFKSPRGEEENLSPCHGGAGKFDGWCGFGCCCWCGLKLSPGINKLDGYGNP